jgi:hypothetical protein
MLEFSPYKIFLYPCIHTGFFDRYYIPALGRGEYCYRFLSRQKALSVTGYSIFQSLSLKLFQFLDFADPDE